MVRPWRFPLHPICSRLVAHIGFSQRKREPEGRLPFKTAPRRLFVITQLQKQKAETQSTGYAVAARDADAVHHYPPCVSPPGQREERG